jgi:hypothetical protein
LKGPRANRCTIAPQGKCCKNVLRLSEITPEFTKTQKMEEKQN